MIDSWEYYQDPISGEIMRVYSKGSLVNLEFTLGIRDRPTEMPNNKPGRVNVRNGVLQFMEWFDKNGKCIQNTDYRTDKNGVTRLF